MRAKLRLSSPAGHAAAAAADRPSRYWGFALIAVCAASWLAVFAGAKLIAALV